jgi:hypothetical protein
MDDNSKKPDAAAIEYIEQIKNEYEEAELRVDKLEKHFDNFPGYRFGFDDNRQTPRLLLIVPIDYTLAMNHSILIEQLYDQVLHYYQIGIQATKEEALISIRRRLRKKQFQIDIIHAEIFVLKQEVETKIRALTDRERISFIRKINDLTITMGEMIRHMKAYEFRAMESIK